MANIAKKPFDFDNVRNSDSSSESSDDELIMSLIPQPAPKKIEPLVLENKPSAILEGISGMNKPALAHKRFSIWSDVLMEQNLADAMQSDMKVSHAKRRNRTHDRGAEDYDVWKKRERNPADAKDRRTTKSWLDKKVPNSKIAKPNESNDKDLSAAEIARRRKRNSKKRERKHRTDEEKITLDIATKLKEPKMQLVRKFNFGLLAFNLL